MTRPLRTAMVFVLLAVQPAVRADPVVWNAVAADSELRYSAYYEGEELSGRFADFSVAAECAAETGEPVSLTVEVATASADMNDREINAEIREPDWFDVASYPDARFESRDIRPTATGYTAVGRLQLKGVEQEIDIPLNWRQEGDTVELTGSVRMSRQNWRIGTGEWASETSLSDRVDVHWRVTLVPVD